jgi:hypothetical protein
MAADVALICAPAGYGKTLLLADWARTSTALDVKAAAEVAYAGEPIVVFDSPNAKAVNI